MMNEVAFFFLTPFCFNETFAILIQTKRGFYPKLIVFQVVKSHEYENNTEIRIEFYVSAKTWHWGISRVIGFF